MYPNESYSSPIPLCGGIMISNINSKNNYLIILSKEVLLSHQVGIQH